MFDDIMMGDKVEFVQRLDTTAIAWRTGRVVCNNGTSLMVNCGGMSTFIVKESDLVDYTPARSAH